MSEAGALVPPGPDEVHVWRVALEGEPRLAERLGAWLAPAERARADRFRFPRDAGRFVIARGRLREILGGYLGLSPERVPLEIGPFGKPRLPDPAHEALRFNLSHSGTLALVAVTGAREVGVDLERMVPELASEDVAVRFFSAWEVQALGRLPTAERVRGFFNCWTRKEAYLKARGVGLALPLDGFAVTLAPGEPARFVEADEPEEAARWGLRALEPEADFVGALAVEGGAGRVLCRTWPGLVAWGD